MASHVLGAAESIASIREAAHQIRAATRLRGYHVDRVNAVQVIERAELTTGEIVRRLEGAAVASIRARRRLPGFIRRLPFTADIPTGRERWSLAYLMDVIYTRDTWMHRVDTARATGEILKLTSDHDGRIVADVVGDWADRHGAPFELTLTGPAGGRFMSGEGGGDTIELDAVGFCRQLSGRTPREDGLLGIATPF